MKTEVGSSPDSISKPKLDFIPGHIIPPDQNNKVPYIPYPVSLHTVDMAILRITYAHEIEILLGRKPGQSLFQFPGGFMDPGETAEQAAERELKEETCLELTFTRKHYLGSFFIDDPRYKDTPHKITSSLFGQFITHDISLNTKASDDLEEIRWFKFSSLESLPLKSFHSTFIDVIMKELPNLMLLK